ncbi:MAG: glycosyltransferase [Pseudomonadota bacterium]|nr:glycosyltransferase [Pseudomonadota bacterium]
MKLLQVIAGGKHGGAEEFFVRLAIALNKVGVEQRVVIRKHEQRAALLREGGVTVKELRFGGALAFITKSALNRYIKMFSPDIVLTWMSRPTKLIDSRKSYIHVARLGGYYNVKYYRGCDHLIANTEDIANYLRLNGWSDQKVHYIPNFVSEPKTVQVNRQLPAKPHDVPLILALGRFHENKAFDILLEAIAILPQAHLWLAGDGKLRNQLERQANDLGIRHRVKFLGWRSEVGALYEAADIVACPSRHEPLGNVIIESWAHGVPVVAADTYGPRSLITEGKTGLICPANDPKALAANFIKLIADKGLQGSLGEHGKIRFKERFSEEIVVKQYIKFFQEISV